MKVIFFGESTFRSLLVFFLLLRPTIIASILRIWRRFLWRGFLVRLIGFYRFLGGFIALIIPSIYSFRFLSLTFRFFSSSFLLTTFFFTFFRLFVTFVSTFVGTLAARSPLTTLTLPAPWRRRRLLTTRTLLGSGHLRWMLRRTAMPRLRVNTWALSTWTLCRWVVGTTRWHLRWLPSRWLRLLIRSCTRSARVLAFILVLLIKELLLPSQLLRESFLFLHASQSFFLLCIGVLNPNLCSKVICRVYLWHYDCYCC